MAVNKVQATNPPLTKHTQAHSSTPNLPGYIKPLESPRAAYMPTSNTPKEVGVAAFKKTQNGIPADKLAGNSHKKKPTVDNLDELAKIPSGSKLPIPPLQPKSRSPTKILELSGKAPPTSQTPKAVTGQSKFQLKVMTSNSIKPASSKVDNTNPER